MKTLLKILLIGLMIGCSGICLAEDVPILPDNPELCPALDEYVTGTITLVEGWNLVAIPVLPKKPLTVEQFLDMAGSPGGNMDIALPQEPGWLMQIPVIAVYKDGEFQRITEDVGYVMVPGEAYFVYAIFTYSYGNVNWFRDPSENPSPRSTPCEINIIGKPLNISVSLNLNRGWNGGSVLLPYQITYSRMGVELSMPFISLNFLSQELIQQGIKAARIAFWDASKQEWEQYQLPYTSASLPDGFIFDKLINSSSGFFLLCGENGLYIPGLTSGPEMPPVPPMPPERVKYTGKIDSLSYIGGSQPPYTHIIWLDNGTGVLLKGANSWISMHLDNAVRSELYIVAGVITTMLDKSDTTYPPREPVPVEVLVVDSITIMIKNS